MTREAGSGTLGLSCAQRGWRFVQMDGQCFVYDEDTEYLARADERVVAGLSTSVPDGSLRAALRTLANEPHRTAASGNSQPTVVSLRLLGVRVDVYCTHQPCAEAISSFYSASLVSAEESGPEVVVWCDLEGQDRYLFRSRPEHLNGTPYAGVSVQTLRSPRLEWTSALPPIPALGAWPFKDRFAALHAATLRMPDGGGVLIAGERGSGKSTAALLLSQRLGAAVLGDETAFVHCRTRLVEPFPHAVGVWREGRKVQVPITELGVRIGSDPVVVGQVVFLERHQAEGGGVRRLTQSEAFRALLPHHRDAGAPPGDAMQTLMGLAAKTDAWLLQYGDLDQLAERICALLSPR